MYKLWKLQRRRKREVDQVNNLFERRAAKASDEPIDSFVVEYEQALKAVENKFSYLESMILLREAKLLAIDLPSVSDWWNYEFAEQDAGSKATHLSEKGKIHVARLIKEERFKNAERQIKLAAILITALAGFVGVVIGLVSILKK